MRINKMNPYYLVDATNVSWPGCLGWRGVKAALAGRGYSSEEEARARGVCVQGAYAARFGSGGPDLRVRVVKA